ncbi:cysteine dioxygenase [Betaproteobacteria bacterium GR16-43]|nr:cysteine dioxygenase [Betaproteobacteria bacterium GR16-43]
MNRLDRFVSGITKVVEEEKAEPKILARASALLSDLIAHDDWLDEEYTVPGTDTYRQYLLYKDPKDRFSVISFVWGPGQKTPVHDHTVWGLVGVMRGAERCEEFTRDASGCAKPLGYEHILKQGQVEAVSPTVGDIHTVANALTDRASISIHVYGADIGRVKRHWFDPATGEAREFISGYSNA